jgi:hypothetical protein
VNPAPFSAEEIFIRQQLDSRRQIVGDQVVYGRDRERETREKGTVLIFGLDGSYREMAWRSVDQRQSRKSLSKGYYSGLNECGDPA